MIDAATTEILIRLGIAMLLGMVIGIERIVAHKTAGMRTYALVSMGAALFVVISEMLVQTHSQNIDPTRIAAQIISGIGFLGAGMIIFKESKLIGLTTATGIWVSAGIGMAAGFGFYSLATIATILTLFIFIVLWFLEERIKELPISNEHHENLEK